jgi:hypothetical protein
VGLVEVDHSGSVVGGCDASLLSGDRLGEAAATQPPEDPDTGRDQDDERDGEAANGSSCFGSQMRAQFACSSAFNSTPPRCRRRSSTAPVTELRMNSSPFPPDKVRALTTSPPGRVTLVPDVT